MKKFVGQWLKRLIKIFSYKNLETAVEESVSSNSNVHIEEYLEFFLGLKHPPEFAVLLSGPWGIGKTHLVKRMLGPMFAGEDAKFAYVSLYGVTSVEQISWEILGQIYPALNSRAGKLGRRLLEAGLKNLPFDAELKPGEIPVLNKPELYVFDDLERADMPLDSILGFINTLVEHDGEKVVLIANETELDRRNGDAYRHKKEKLIGKTLGVNPSLSEAVSFFFSQVDDPQALRFLESEKERLVRVYDESGIKNLRLLKQTIWDFERLFKFVPKRYSQHRNFSDFFSLFFALSIEYKSGSLRSKDISERTRARMKDIKASTRGQLGKGSEKVEFSPFKLLDDKYGSVDIYREWPTDSFMFDVIVNGRVLPNAVENEMSASPYFGVSDKTPNWKILWEFFDIPESVIQKALDELWEEIEKKQITNPLHFLQVWGILFFYSELKIVNFSRSDILKKGSCYINDLVRDDRFSILDPNDPWNSDITSFDGYGFHEIDSDEMVQLIKLVKRAQEEALKRKLPKLAEELCEQMQHDIDAFNAAISSPSAKNSLYSTPVFTSVPVDEFWDNLLNLEPAAHTKVFSGLKARYAGRRLLNELQVEAPWLKEFERRGKERIKNLSPILGAQLEKRLQLIGRLVVEFDEEK